MQLERRGWRRRRCELYWVHSSETAGKINRSVLFGEEACTTQLSRSLSHSLSFSLSLSHPLTSPFTHSPHLHISPSSQPKLSSLPLPSSRRLINRVQRFLQLTFAFIHLPTDIIIYKHYFNNIPFVLLVFIITSSPATARHSGAWLIAFQGTQAFMKSAYRITSK